MTKYLFKDFKYILNNITDPRYYYEYRKDNDTHCIGLNFTIDDDPMVTLILIENLKINRALSLLEADDYSFEGSMVVFKQKNHAAIFYMYR